MNKNQLDLVRLFEKSSQNPTKLESGEILVWLYFSQIEDFVNIVGHDFFCEDNFQVNLQSNCLCVDIKKVISYMGIDEDTLNIERFI